MYIIIDRSLHIRHTGFCIQASFFNFDCLLDNFANPITRAVVTSLDISQQYRGVMLYQFEIST